VTVVDVEITEHLRAVVAHLKARGRLCEWGRRPDGGGWAGAPGQSLFVGYVVAYRISTLEVPAFGLRVRHTEARPAIQLSCFGADPDQANELLDEVKKDMLDGSLVVPGRRIERIIHEPGASDVKDPDEKPAVYYSADRYRIWTLPAGQ
jgi:hypothetical protein